jgi:hypothetical protein
MGAGIYGGFGNTYGADLGSTDYIFYPNRRKK